MKGEKLQVFWGQRPYGAENSLSSGVICGLYSQGRKPDFFFFNSNQAPTIYLVVEIQQICILGKKKIFHTYTNYSDSFA